MTARAPAAGRVVLAGSLALTATVVPAFLAGALSGRIGDDLGFGEGASGAAVAAFFVGAGAFAVPMGRATERYGPTAAMRAGVVISGASALAVAALASAWWQLALALLVAGSAVGLVDTGAARAFGDAVPERRHGLAFGTKEASVPAAALVAGLSIPVLADRAGWRAAFVLTALLAPLVWLVVPRLDATPPARDDADAGGVQHQRTRDPAGVASITVRVLAGVRGDRRPTGTWAMLATLICIGAVGAILLAAVEGGVAGVVGSLAVIGAGWGWTGLAFQTAVRVSSGRPAAAAGVVLTGLSVGGVAGPAAFGAIASAASYGAAWVVAAVALVLGAGAIAASRPALEPVG